MCVGQKSNPGLPSESEHFPQLIFHRKDNLTKVREPPAVELQWESTQIEDLLGDRKSLWDFSTFDLTALKIMRAMPAGEAKDLIFVIL